MCFYSGGFKFTYQKTTATLSHTDTTRHNSGVIFIPLLPERTSFPYPESPFILMAKESNKRRWMNSTRSFLRSQTNVAVPHRGMLAPVPHTTCHCHRVGAQRTNQRPETLLRSSNPEGRGEERSFFCITGWPGWSELVVEYCSMIICLSVRKIAKSCELIV